MMTLRHFSHKPESIPATTSWYLADLGEARGKQELFTKQTPRILKVLREHSLIESAVSSNRIEGVTVDQSRIRTVVFGKSHLRDREFEERVGQLRSPKGAKTVLITTAIERAIGPFRVADIQRECPGVSVDMIRRVLKILRESGQVECLGLGQNAQWQKKGNR